MAIVCWMIAMTNQAVLVAQQEEVPNASESVNAVNPEKQGGQDGARPQNGPDWQGLSPEQRKAEFIKHVSEEIARLAQKLDLSEAQLAPFSAQMTKYFSAELKIGHEAYIVNQEAGGDRRAMRSKITALYKRRDKLVSETNKAMGPILEKGQLKEFKEILAMMNPKPQRRGPGDGGASGRAGSPRERAGRG